MAILRALLSLKKILELSRGDSARRGTRLYAGRSRLDRRSLSRRRDGRLALVERLDRRRFRWRVVVIIAFKSSDHRLGPSAANAQCRSKRSLH